MSGTGVEELSELLRHFLDSSCGRNSPHQTAELPIEGIARVVGIREDGKRALMFEQIAEDDRQRLIRVVFECMRTARARTRRTTSSSTTAP